MEKLKMEILGVKWQNWRKQGTGLMLHQSAKKPRNTGVLKHTNASAK
jgi:hypothetical protein